MLTQFTLVMIVYGMLSMYNIVTKLAFKSVSQRLIVTLHVPSLYSNGECVIKGQVLYHLNNYFVLNFAFM